MTDMKERMVDMERDFKKYSKEKSNLQERLDALDRDMDHIMGRRDTSDVSGIPTIVSKILKIRVKLTCPLTKGEAYVINFVQKNMNLLFK